MSKYSKKVERQLREARRIAESKNRKQEKKEDRQMKAEKKRVRKELKKIEAFQSQEKTREQIIIEQRRQLRKNYLESLKVGNIKLIELTSKSMLSYEVGLKLEQQNLEQRAVEKQAKGEITL